MLDSWWAIWLSWRTTRSQRKRHSGWFGHTNIRRRIRERLCHDFSSVKEISCEVKEALNGGEEGGDKNSLPIV